jgi:hypothetical protein
MPHNVPKRPLLVQGGKDFFAGSHGFAEEREPLELPAVPLNKKRFSKAMDVALTAVQEIRLKNKH